MKKIRRKITLASIAVLSLLATAVTTTYAWFSLNDSAFIEGFDISIENTDNLLISTDGIHFKQSLNATDVIESINSLREEENKITQLSDIKFNAVTSKDGLDFKQQVLSFDELNRKAISYEIAPINHYLKMKLYFTVEENGTIDDTTQHENYNLNFKTQSKGGDGVHPTRFSSKNQNLITKNTLTNLTGPLTSGSSITVNPVNALRLAVLGSTVESSSNQDLDVIYDIAQEHDMGSYALDSNVLQTLDEQYQLDKYNSEKNAMFTYFNSVQNNILKPMITYEADDELETAKSDTLALLDKIQTSMDNNLGTFIYNPEISKYNIVELTITLWIEGFDADNIIGLNTSNIEVLLSFEKNVIE